MHICTRCMYKAFVRAKEWSWSQILMQFKSLSIFNQVVLFVIYFLFHKFHWGTNKLPERYTTVSVAHGLLHSFTWKDIADVSLSWQDCVCSPYKSVFVLQHFVIGNNIFKLEKNDWILQTVRKTDKRKQMDALKPIDSMAREKQIPLTRIIFRTHVIL